MVDRVQYLSKLVIMILSAWLLVACSNADSVMNTPIENPDSPQNPIAMPAQTVDSGSPETGLPLPAVDIDPVQLAWFYKPPKENAANFLAENYDFFILTKLDEELKDELRDAYGVSAPILRYIRFDAIMDPGSCLEQPYRNQVADEIGDFCRISQEHPDWFLLDVNGNRIVNDDGNYFFMDPGNQEWRTFWLERVKKNQEQFGWVGLFLDNVEAGFSKRERTDGVPSDYQSVEAYQLAIRGFLQYIHDTYTEPTGQLLYANVLSEESPDGLLSYLPYLDGVMLEGFAVDWDDGYRTPKEWGRQLELVEMIGERNIGVLMVAKGDEIETNRLKFAFASYLLVTNGNMFFRFALNGRTNVIVQHEIYYLDLGQPVSARYLDGDTWIRGFENGTVRVNPSTKEAEILMGQ